ncbi:MAG: 50S ribosomal protein L5, partial [Bacteroidota bacterium]
MAKEKKQQQKKEEKKGPGVREVGVYPRLAEKYKKDIIPAMMKQFKYKNVMQVPKLEKISVNVGVGQATQ